MLLTGNENYQNRFSYEDPSDFDIQKQNLILYTERLLLRPISEADTHDIFLNFDKDTAQHLYYKHCNTIDDAKHIINKSLEGMEKGNRVVFVITDKTSNEFLGCIGVYKLDTNSPEIGFPWIKKSAVRNGYFSEAFLEVIKWIYMNVNFAYFYMFVAEGNEAGHTILKSYMAVLGEKLPPMSTPDPYKVLNVYEYRIYRKHLTNILGM